MKELVLKTHRQARQAPMDGGYFDNGYFLVLKYNYSLKYSNINGYFRVLKTHRQAGQAPMEGGPGPHNGAAAAAEPHP